jgi:hypothetical protein
MLCQIKGWINAEERSTVVEFPKTGFNPINGISHDKNQLDLWIETLDSVATGNFKRVATIKGTAFTTQSLRWSFAKKPFVSVQTIQIVRMDKEKGSFSSGIKICGCWFNKAHNVVVPHLLIPGTRKFSEKSFTTCRHEECSGYVRDHAAWNRRKTL